MWIPVCTKIMRCLINIEVLRKEKFKDRNEHLKRGNLFFVLFVRLGLVDLNNVFCIIILDTL
jgi:hypothetical protein